VEISKRHFFSRSGHWASDPEALNLGDVKQFTFEYRGSRYLEDIRLRKASIGLSRPGNVITCFDNLFIGEFKFLRKVVVRP